MSDVEPELQQASSKKRKEDDSPSGESDTKPKLKRNRAKLTCLACKRRKTKCDKGYPCLPCLARGKGNDCSYEDGRIPPQNYNSATVPISEFEAMQRQLRRLEAALIPASIASSSSPVDRIETPAAFLPRLPVSDPDTHRAAVQEKAFVALEGLAVMSYLEPASRHVTPGVEDGTCRSKNEEFWPNILATSKARRSPKWSRDMLQVIEALPPKAHMDPMIDFYFTEMQILRITVHEGVFRTELAQFEALRSMGMHMSIDPGWLTQLTAILWVTCRFIIDEGETSPSRISLGLSLSALSDMTTTLCEAMETALACSGWLFNPQFRVLQAVLVVATLEMNRQGKYDTGALFGNASEGARCMFFDVAVGLCRSLQLYGMQTAEDVARLQDPALSSSSPLYNVEITRRTLYTILYLDTITNCARPDPLPYCFPLDCVSTPQPANYDEEELLALRPKPPREPWEKTRFIWEYHQNQVIKFWRIIISAMHRTEEMPYETVLELSQAIRDVHESFLNIKANHTLTQTESNAFYLVNSTYQQRLLRLHRPFLLRSYKEPKYLQSQKLLLSVSRQMSRTHSVQLSENGDQLLIRNALYPYIHHVSSLLILAIHALVNPEARRGVSEDMKRSSEMFFHACSKGHRAHFRSAAKAFCLVTEMIKVLQEPPADVENIEAIIQSIHARAVVQQRTLHETLMGSVSSNKMDQDPPGADFLQMDLWNKEVVAMSSAGTAGVIQQSQGWDLEWGIYVNDL